MRKPAIATLALALVLGLTTSALAIRAIDDTHDQTVGGQKTFTGTTTIDAVGNVDTLRVEDKPWVDVTHATYGATGDGVTNDAAAIQAAIDALSNGGYVFLPEGTYNLGTTTLTLKNSRWLIGAGARSLGGGNTNAATKIVYTGTTTAITVAGGSNNWGIRDMLIHCNTGTLTACIDVVEGSGNRFGTIERVAFKGSTGTGLRFTGETSCNCFHTVRHGLFNGFTTGVALSGFANGNLFEELHLSSLGTPITLEALGTDTVGGSDNVFIRNEISTSTVTGVNIDDSASRNVFIKLVEDGTNNNGFVIAATATNNAFYSSVIDADTGTNTDSASTTRFFVTSGYQDKFVTVATAQTIAAGNTITANACGTAKTITSAGAVTTSTTDTFTAPAAANNGCIMDVCNVGANTITLDANANFISAGAADVALTANDCVRVGSDGTDWRQIAPVMSLTSGTSLPVADTTSVVEGSADGTKEIRFEVDGLTTSTTRVLTPPDANIVIAGSTSALTSGRIAVVTTSGLLTDTANLTWDNTNFRLRGQNMTTATDNATNMAQLSGTLPTSPSAEVHGIQFSVTSAGSAAQLQKAFVANLAAGYTGAASTTGVSITNAAAGTEASLNVGSASSPGGNKALELFANGASTAGSRIAGMGKADDSTDANIGFYGQATDTIAGTNVGLLGSAANSTEVTGPKNIGVLGTLTTTSPDSYASMNGSFAGLFDAGTLAEAAGRIIRGQGTLPTTPSTTAIGYDLTATSNGSAAQAQIAVLASFEAGYTGSSLTRGLQATNAVAGTGNTLNLNVATGSTSNQAGFYNANATTTGMNIGVEAVAIQASGNNIGAYAKATSAVAGSNIGVLGNAAASTEATDLKNVAGYFTLNSALVTASNISVALLAQSDGTEDIFRGYDGTTLIYRMEDSGEFTSAGTASLGWAVVTGANVACTTTCTNAAVFGFDSGAATIVGPSDATADVCVCAGAS